MKRCKPVLGAGLVALSMGIAVPSARAEISLIDALTKGKVDFFARMRYEHVEDDGSARGTGATRIPFKDADALTLRTALGYETKLFHGFGGYLQFEDVRSLVDDYNDGTYVAPAAGAITTRAKFASIIDPEGTEVQQANMRYEGLPYTVIRAGRQEIQHRDAPLHRFIGNILWRQNWQSFDAVRVTTSLVPDLETGARLLNLDYTYAWNVDRIFGEDNVLPDRADYPMASHFFKANWDGFALAKLEGYVYSLDFNHGALPTIGGKGNASFGLSTNTFGIRAEGSKGFGTKLRVLYTGEFAHQTDAYNNPAAIDVNYYLGEGGIVYSIGKKWLKDITLKASYEVLEGDGVATVPGTATKVRQSFQTPLGTNHAFQGWADRFLTTPGDGIDDLFFTMKATVVGNNLMLMYHDFSSDHLNYDYGTEIDVVAERPINKNFMVGAKYADYQADSDPTNRARDTAALGGVGQSFDKEIVWVYAQFKY